MGLVCSCPLAELQIFFPSSSDQMSVRFVTNPETSNFAGFERIASTSSAASLWYDDAPQTLRLIISLPSCEKDILAPESARTWLSDCPPYPMSSPATPFAPAPFPIHTHRQLIPLHRQPWCCVHARSAFTCTRSSECYSVASFAQLGPSSDLLGEYVRIECLS